MECDLTRIADCQCGGVHLTCEGEPTRVSVCHCLACQKRSGSAFAAQARYARGQIAVAGETREFIRIADSGEHIYQHFGPACGTGLFYYLKASPDITAVPVGLFADPQLPAPRYSVYEDRKHPWVEIATAR
ncbi:GFA family protein [Rhizobium tumorigenes]|uniref:GFA family protein n=1 Tax=Rhizobium tumorigenes TaxID=2041385 RepID=A0AAF1KSS2_9HYPH|nr:GFA family protein [Rhizobium tumorigenes]WFR97928.1 GFA family protein [Rhizobium tumorigenes]